MPSDSFRPNGIILEGGSLLWWVRLAVHCAADMRCRHVLLWPCRLAQERGPVWGEAFWKLPLRCCFDRLLAGGFWRLPSMGCSFDNVLAGGFWRLPSMGCSFDNVLAGWRNSSIGCACSAGCRLHQLLSSFNYLRNGGMTRGVGVNVSV